MNEKQSLGFLFVSSFLSPFLFPFFLSILSFPHSFFNSFWCYSFCSPAQGPLPIRLPGRSLLTYLHFQMMRSVLQDHFPMDSLTSIWSYLSNFHHYSYYYYRKKQVCQRGKNNYALILPCGRFIDTLQMARPRWWCQEPSKWFVDLLSRKSVFNGKVSELHIPLLQCDYWKKVATIMH